ncbi:MAG: hypothetical protein KAJ03_04125 [Gammaproteobacteria bacterium]|nr:hypothetical protein [Gammaproteobacteria bacterium]
MQVAITLTQGFIINVEPDEYDEVEEQVLNNDFADLQDRLDSNPTHFEGQVGIIEGQDEYAEYTRQERRTT